ncbi:polyprenyl synthetase family protein [Micromonospora sp. WMMD736]|uniref:polyprenyl synthetase family protein n=1 Tax=Micromonospora sp. WMMD736 TaxID=3404112 RepID=UPI003B9301E7
MSSNGHVPAAALTLRRLAAPAEGHEQVSFTRWRSGLREVLATRLSDFLNQRCVPDLRGAGIDIAPDLLLGFLEGGKYLRSTFTYLGWLCGADPDEAALRAAASFELLHAFALLQDDVMDGSALRRGKPAVHVTFAQWHRDRGLSGSPKRFGEAAAVLLGDLCLVWAEQMLRESGVAPTALERAWPRYDEMRSELAIGQFGDLVNDASGYPTLDSVLAVARRKSGNYTVRRPLEIGAALAGCDQRVLTMIAEYGEAIGEAFQLRDDVLGIFGSPSITGKPAGGDLAERKATSVVVVAYELADGAVRRELLELMRLPDLGAVDVRKWRGLIETTGAPQLIEQMIDARVTRALDRVHNTDLDESIRTALTEMAVACTERAT